MRTRTALTLGFTLMLSVPALALDRGDVRREHRENKVERRVEHRDLDRDNIQHRSRDIHHNQVIDKHEVRRAMRHPHNNVGNNVNIGNKVIVAPRRRTVNNIVVGRPYGHSYYGYGHYHDDNDAWKWLSFTAITLKILDNINESAQREHEEAQIKATTAPVGEQITWNEGDSSGYVVATKEGNDSGGNTCREFQQSITVGGKEEQAYGTACLQSDGSWKIVN
ncbi:hypothetical protein [Motilimonas pumila]|uniref:Surface antigen domain-containing protein n=1 Tax=Motilimonas pumila TaxID=2303987 RepID=A0A418YIV1_9GAMM|nr:hypothetical protein [Motilimonas pumila]RJG50568.1 hypothetical protein D1Z90_03605 [Motilimonas pumila]